MALPVVSFVVNKLGDFAIREALLSWGLHDKVDRLRRELQAISSFLEDADRKQKHDAMVKNWVKEIREIAYDAEDIIDKFILEFERHRFRPRLLFRHSIGRKIEDINARIGDIASHRAKYGIGNISEASSSSLDHGLQKWRRSWPHIDDEVVVGFERDAQILLDRLLDPQTRRGVISIVGMGGIGKTTLAAKIFKELSTLRRGGLSQSSHPKSFRNEPVVRNAFEVCVWISLTHDPVIDDLLVGLITEVRKQKNFVGLPRISEKTTSELIEVLFQLLTGRRYLIVMDDLWRKDIWDLIKEVLPDVNGSRVVLTTRFIEIAKHADSDSNPYHLQPLNDEKSRQLLLRRIFPLWHSTSLSTLPAELEDLSWQLSRKCGGLPLALVVLGGLLSGKEKLPAVWLNLVNSMTWESTDDGKQCLKVLALSYNDLSYYMKSCFLYFCAFPQGYDILSSKLIQLWIAEGLILQEEGRTMEETAENYLEELIQRCLVQSSKRESYPSVKRICLHDLLRELSISEARECRFFHVKDTTILDAVSRVEQEVHRLSLHQLSLYGASQASITLNGNMKLRTLLVFPKRRMLLNDLGPRFSDPTDPKRSIFKPIKEMEWIQIAKSYFQLSNTPSSPPYIIAYKSSSNFEFMRVLDLGGMHSLDELPQETERMTHLRYLDLQETNLDKLPSAIAKLKLQTLNIRGTRIVRLPDAFWSLETLRHLYLNDMVYYPPLLEGLINLQTLDGVWIEGSLPKLINLRKLRAVFASNVDTLYFLGHMVHLVSLKLDSYEIPSDVFTAIAAHQTLQKLKLTGELSSKQFPDIEFPRYLTKLTLKNLKLTEDPIPQLERLLSLRILKLLNFAYVGRDMKCSAGGFPQLHCLDLGRLPCLSDWRVEQGAMPSLTRLTIWDCTSLGMLPEGLRHIVSLQKLHLKCMEQIVDRVRRDEGEDWYKIAHVTFITVTSSRGDSFLV